ncbi:MAG: DNA polymerase I [Candidatus Firestonebacteria bacterium]
MSVKRREIDIKRLLLVDGNSYLYRCYYAIKNLSTSKGIPTNAVFGLARLLLKILKEIKPDYLAFAFDTKGPTFRHKEFKDYKIKREPPPEDLIQQIPIVKDMLNCFNIPTYEIEGYEGDDLIAYFTKKGEENNLKVTILTGDKDMLQLINENVEVMSVYKEEFIYNEQKVIEKYGVKPCQIVDFLGLAGDTADNIPGVKGIGEKTASSLLKEFKDLDSIFNNINKIKNEKLKNRLQEHKEIAILSKKIATLVSPPLKVKLSNLEFKEPNTEKVLKLFSELEFKRLIEDFNKLISKPGDEGLFKQEIIKCEKILIENEDSFKKFLTELNNIKEISIDVNENEILLSLKPSTYYSFNFTRMKNILADKNISKIGHNFKNMMHILSKHKLNISGIKFETRLASYLIDSNKENYGALTLVSAYLSQNINEKEIVCFNNDLKNILQKELDNQNLTFLFENVEMPLIEVLYKMETTGIKIDIDFLKELSNSINVKLNEIIKNIYNLAKEEFNINSPRQLSKILFEKLKLPVIKKTKTGPSTDVEVLEELSKTEDIAVVLLDYRQLTKLKNTYIDVLPQLVDKKTNRIHTSFNQTGTSTGRLSSVHPNLQNIPIKTEIGREIRKAFVPEDTGWKILSADYSQIDLRVLAHFSLDKNLINAFNNDEDIHTRTAMEIFSISKEMVDSEKRRVAKTVNFGIIYGMTPFGLAKELKISKDIAKQYIENYFLKYPGVKMYMIGAIEKARKLGYVETILNRRRYIPEINSKNKMVRGFAEREAINMPIQGSASDIIKLAMINIHKTIKKENLSSRMILQVHDELIFECVLKELNSLKEIIKETMENAVKLKVPLKIDIKTGDNWGALK